MNERLEEIFREYTVELNGNRVFANKSMQYLFEQAERVEELENGNSGLCGRICKLEKENNDMWAENKRYKKALEFYVNPYNWQDGEIYLDSGKTARKALEDKS